MGCDGGGMAVVRVISSAVDLLLLLVGMTAGELPSAIYAQGGQPTTRSTWSMKWIGRDTVLLLLRQHHKQRRRTSVGASFRPVAGLDMRRTTDNGRRTDGRRREASERGMSERAGGRADERTGKASGEGGVLYLQEKEGDARGWAMTSAAQPDTYLSLGLSCMCGSPFLYFFAVFYFFFC